MTIDQRMEQEEHDADLKVNRAIKRNKLLDATWNAFQEKTPAQIKKEWGMESGSDGLVITKYKGEETSFVIPEIIGGKKVIHLADDSFRHPAALRAERSLPTTRRCTKQKQ